MEVHIGGKPPKPTRKKYNSAYGVFYKALENAPLNKWVKAEAGESAHTMRMALYNYVARRGYSVATQTEVDDDGTVWLWAKRIEEAG